MTYEAPDDYRLQAVERTGYPDGGPAPIGRCCYCGAAFSKEATSGRYPKVSFADYEAHNYPEKDEWLYSSFWYKDFDGMAHKTMLRQLISKWGVMSIDLQTAFDVDGAVVTENGEYIHIESEAAQEALPEPQEQDDIQHTVTRDEQKGQVSLSDI